LSHCTIWGEEEMTELASGGVGQDKLFWEDAAVDYDKKEYGV